MTSTAQLSDAELGHGTTFAPDPGRTDSKIGEVSQGQLMFRRFKQSKLAVDLASSSWL